MLLSITLPTGAGRATDPTIVADREKLMSDIQHYRTDLHSTSQTLATDRKALQAELKVFGEFLDKMHKSSEGEQTLLDRTAIFHASNLGNSSAHDNPNLPVLLAGGEMKHQGHLAFDRDNNTLLSNLFVRMMHHMGIEAKSFGASTGVVSDV